MFIGCKTPYTKKRLLRAFETATPSAILNYSGGVSSLVAEIMNAVVSVMHDDVGLLKQIVKAPDKDRVKRGMPFPVRIDMISPAVLLSYVAGPDLETEFWHSLGAKHTTHCPNLSLCNYDVYAYIASTPII